MACVLTLDDGKAMYTLTAYKRIHLDLLAVSFAIS